MSRRTGTLHALVREGVLLTGPARVSAVRHTPRVRAALGLPKA